MTNLFVAYVATYFLPLLFLSWRVAVIGLGLQGVLLAMLLAAHHGEWSWSGALELASLLAIRAVFVPWYLYHLMHDHDLAEDFALISKNLAQWMFAFLLLVIAFSFGVSMSPDDPEEALQVGTATGSILVAMLILANQRHPLGQIIALLNFEGGVTLVELLSPHAVPPLVGVGISLTFVVFVLTCGPYLRRHAWMTARAEDQPDGSDL